MEHENDIIIVENDKELDNEIIEETEEIEETPKIEREKRKFNNYTTERLDKVYEKYEVVQAYNPKRQKKDDNEFSRMIKDSNFESSTETFTYKKVETKPKLGARLKKRLNVLIVACCAIVVGLTTLTIINSVNINNINTGITVNNTQIIETDDKIDKIIKDIGKLTDEDNLNNSAGEMGFDDPATNVEIELIEKNEIVENQSKTNFFDSICNFFRNLFGG